ncbi:unnamed protein product [Paramecium pentaurelia]|uniref:Ankyrin repeat protein n=1 Tax=Paramecium pentaurelia TaxID=43138 RepID=A0A8S1T9K7_9CILI|nr:unnamed protein product [Paramecium pentaurelia]
MKIVIRYYNDWGILNVEQLKISSKYKISELYDQVSNLTGIDQNQLKLILIQTNEKVTFQIKKIVLDELNLYICDYQIQQGSAIFAQKTTDPFSDMASSFSSQFDPSQFLDTSANSIPEQETIFQLIRLSLLSDLELFLEDRNDRAQLINGIELTGWNALHLVTFLGDEKMYLWLISSGGDISILSKDGWNCLQIAIWQSNIKMTNLIMGSNSINVNQITIKGTALHIAAQIDDQELIELLLKHPKIDISITFQGKSVVDVAGDRTKKILQKELLILRNKQFDIINSFRQSICTFYSLNSFFTNRPQKPPIIKGSAKIVSYFKLLLIDNYLICDPDSGAIARYKTSIQYPFNPKYIIYIF